MVDINVSASAWAADMVGFDLCHDFKLDLTHYDCGPLHRMISDFEWLKCHRFLSLV